jgi:hypothetical protein
MVLKKQFLFVSSFVLFQNNNCFSCLWLFLISLSVRHSFEKKINSYGSFQGRCVICGGHGISDAYYCKECTILEKDVSDCCCNVSFFKKKLNFFLFFVCLFVDREMVVQRL